MAKVTVTFTYESTGDIAAFFDGTTRDRTLTADRVVELLTSYTKSRSREEGKREDAALMRELMKREENGEVIRKMRESLGR